MKNLFILFLIEALLTVTAAAQSAKWVGYGLQSDGTAHSWNTEEVEINGQNSYKVWSRTVFNKLESVPGRNKLPPMKTLLTRYIINCKTKLVQPIEAIYLDAQNNKIAFKNQYGPENYANSTGDRVRDRFFLSVCTRYSEKSLNFN